jgi:exosortase/archaeosortase family protein
LSGDREPKPRPARHGGLGGFIRGNPVLIRQWLAFLAWISAFVALAQWAVNWVNVRLAEYTASALAAILSLLGWGGRAEGIEVHSRLCHFQIIGECTAYYPCAIYISAVLSYPCPLRTRLVGLLLGLPALLAINQGRLLTLCWIYHYHYERFETVHLLVWQSLIVFFTVLLWILWVSTLARRHATHPS